MMQEDILSLARGGETLNVEFKSERSRPFEDRDLVEAVVCMANRPSSDPGYVLIGVEDDGSITGARPRHDGGTEPARVQALIANSTRPSLSCAVHEVVVGTHQVLVVNVPSSPTPVATADGKFVRRAITVRGTPECRPMQYHEMQGREATRGLQDYAALVVPEASWHDLDPLEFERFRRSIRESRGRGDLALVELPDDEMARALGAVEGDRGDIRLRVLALLLFGREEAIARFLPTAEVAFQILRGTSIEVNDFMRWPLLRTMEAILERFRARNREEEMMLGLVRIGVPDYSERGFREGLANALIHRDYTRMGGVHVQWHEDRLEVSNPGGFPEGVRLDNILVAPPRPRSLLLADAFKRAGVVERTGRGVDTIFEEQLRNGRPAPSYERSSEIDVVLVIPGGKANLQFVRLLVEEESAAQRSLSLDELLLLNDLWLERRLTTQEASTVIQKPELEARRSLERLVESGLAEASGVGRARSYHLSASTYRRLGDNAAYVRQRGFEPLQQEQMILQYVRAHGRITRGGVVELCRVSPRQARALLARLVRNGSLRLRGIKRNAFYELP